MPDHEQTQVFCPGYQETIEVDRGIAPLMLAIWDAGILTCNSCEENEPGMIWIEFYSFKDAEKFLMILIRTLGDGIRRRPEANDWLCHRILGLNGDQLAEWRYDAHPNLLPARANQRSIYSGDPKKCEVEISVSLRFPREDYNRILELLHSYLRSDIQRFDELSDDQWNYVKRYLPPQPLRGRKRVDDRKVLNGILYLRRTGCGRRNFPEKYGTYITIQKRMKQWSSQGLLELILDNINFVDAETCKNRESNNLGRAKTKEPFLLADQCANYKKKLMADVAFDDVQL